MNYIFVRHLQNWKQITKQSSDIQESSENLVLRKHKDRWLNLNKNPVKMNQARLVWNSTERQGALAENVPLTRRLIWQVEK